MIDGVFIPWDSSFMPVVPIDLRLLERFNILYSEGGVSVRWDWLLVFVYIFATDIKPIVLVLSFLFYFCIGFCVTQF